MSELPTILRRIAEDRLARRALQLRLNAEGAMGEVTGEAIPRLPRRGTLIEALKQAAAPAVIAEAKRASPSAGLLHPRPWDPVVLAQGYQAAGATALSVLTEPRYFWGSLLDLARVRAHTLLPILRKDFLLDRDELQLSAKLGADAVLLIVALLDPARLQDLLDEAHGLGLDALVEVHDEAEAERALEVGARLVGINNRNLHSFEVDLGTSARLAPKLVAAGCTVVAESGLSTPEQLRSLGDAGVKGFLVGGSLLQQEDPAAALLALREGAAVPSAPDDRAPDAP